MLGTKLTPYMDVLLVERRLSRCHEFHRLPYLTPLRDNNISTVGHDSLLNVIILMAIGVNTQL